MLSHCHPVPPWPNLILQQLIHKVGAPTKQLFYVEGQHLLSVSLTSMFPEWGIESDIYTLDAQ